MVNEKRLIDANELLRFLENEIDKHESSLNKWERDYVKAVRVAAKILRCFPTVDAVEVVRCKDCRHCTPDENIIGAYGYCYHFGCYAHEPMVEADDFCSYGERKDNVQ